MKLAKRAPLCETHRLALSATIARHGLQLTDAQIRSIAKKAAAGIPVILAEKGYRLRRWECPCCDMTRVHDEAGPCSNPECPGHDLVTPFFENLARGLTDRLRQILGGTS